MTQKARTAQYKAIEGVITKATKNGKVQLSSRCADVDREMAVRMGVSSAVLINVVFCHQEDSNWPLSAPTELKKKFDEIFSATRYIKALEEIKKCRKEHMANVKIMTNDLMHLKEKKEKVKELRADFEQNQQHHHEVSATIAELEEELAPIAKQIKKASGQLSDVQKLRSRIDLKMKDKENAEKGIADLKEELVMLPDTDAQLEDKKSNFEQSKDNKERDLHKLQKVFEKLLDEQDRLQQDMDGARTKMGEFKNSHADHEAKKQKRDARIRDVAARRNVGGFDGVGTLSPERVTAFLDKLNEIQRRKETDMSTMQLDHEAENSRLQSALDEVKADITQNKERLKAIERSEKDCRAKKNAAEAELLAMDTVTSHDDLMDERREVADKLKALKERFASAKHDGVINEAETDVKNHQKEIERLNEIQQKINSQLELRTQIAQLGKTAEKDGKTRDKLYNRRKVKLEEIFKQPVAQSVVMKQYETKHHALKQEVEGLKREQTGANKKVLKGESALDRADGELDRLRKELRIKVNKIKQVCGASSRESKMAEHKEKLEDLDEELMTVSAASRIMDKANEHQKCPTCNRKFLEDGEPHQSLEDFVAMWQDRLLALKTNDADEIKRSKETVAEMLQALISLEDEVTRRDELEKDEIPDLEREQERISNELDDFREQEKAVDGSLNSKEADLKGLEAMRSDCADIERLTREVKKNEDLLESEKSKLYEIDDNMDTDDCIARLTEENDSVVQKRKKVDRLKKVKEQKTGDIRNAEKDLGAFDLRAKQLELDEKERATKKKEMNGFEAQIEKFIIDRAEEESKGGPNTKKLQAAREAQERATGKNQKELRRLTKELSSVAEDNKDLKRTVDEIKAYVTAGKDKRLALEEAKLKEKATALTRNQQLSKERSSEIQTLNEQVATEQVRQRQIVDNLKYRGLEHDLEAYEIDLEDWKAELAAEGQGAEKDWKELERKKMELTKQIAGYTGQRGVLLQRANEKKAELKSSMYRDADAKFRERMIEEATTRGSLNDLQTYYNALDQAVVSFHKIRMKEINDSVKDLWESTYRGGDIDYIEILSDEEKPAGSKAKLASLDNDMTKRKSYKYRVVMVKGKSKLDMRGRCSAGQKVLASIIIRLALADTFCLQCGVFTLDEPTTNLDAENIDSLAEALSNLISARREQSNFQMIIITHDEKFVQKLGRNGVSDSYYHISKQPHAVHQVLASTITARKIRDLGAEVGAEEADSEF